MGKSIGVRSFGSADHPSSSSIEKILARINKYHSALALGELLDLSTPLGITRGFFFNGTVCSLFQTFSHFLLVLAKWDATVMGAHRAKAVRIYFDAFDMSIYMYVKNDDDSCSIIFLSLPTLAKGFRSLACYSFWYFHTRSLLFLMIWTLFGAARDHRLIEIQARPQRRVVRHISDIKNQFWQKHHLQPTPVKGQIIT